MSQIKLMVVVAFCLLSSFNVICQTHARGEFSLVVKRDINQIEKIKYFKQGKRLKLNTMAGEVFYLWEYAINADHVLAADNLLINFDDIIGIKGRISNDAERFVPGFILFFTGLALTGMLGFYGAWTSSGYMILFATPGIAISVAGLSLMGHRAFKMKNGWKIHTIPLSY